MNLGLQFTFRVYNSNSGSCVGGNLSLYFYCSVQIAWELVLLIYYTNSGNAP